MWFEFPIHDIVVAGCAGIYSQFVPTSFSYTPVKRMVRGATN